ncbi:MAG: threonine synthase [Paracoccaceae bacterium]
MKYISTRGSAPILSFEEAMLSGLARDGGLYLPESIPTLSHADIAALSGLPYEEVAFRIMRPFIGETFTDDEFAEIIAKAYAGFGHDARAPMVQLAENHFLLELFHGPTLAFKDFAMQLIGQLFQASLKRSGNRVTIVGATSGDTGSAAIEAFRGLDAVDVFILYPHGRVSEVQRRQMTTPNESNVHALAMDGHFDDCQARVKDMFNDFDFRDGVRLAGVNSINWARVLAQVVYYFSSAVSLGAPHRKVSFTVPTGNFGDIFAGYIAKRMGLPIEQLVVATNQNDILHRCLATGEYRPDGVIPSISPSMDIQVSSNFERALFYAYGGDGAAISALMEELQQGGFNVSQGAREALAETFNSGRVSEEDTLATIRDTFARTGELLCPHSAVGVQVANAQRIGHTPMITLATAHPAKFPDAVKTASGQHPALPLRMADLFDREERVTRIGNDLGAIETLIRERIAL